MTESHVKNASLLFLLSMIANPRVGRRKGFPQAAELLARELDAMNGGNDALNLTHRTLHEIDELWGDRDREDELYALRDGLRKAVMAIA